MQFLIHLVFHHVLRYHFLIVTMILNFVLLKHAIFIFIRQMINVKHKIQYVHLMEYNVLKDFNVMMQKQNKDVLLIFLVIYVNGLVVQIHVLFVVVVQHQIHINQKHNVKTIILVVQQNLVEDVQLNLHVLLQLHNKHAQHQYQEKYVIGMNLYQCVEINHVLIL